MSLDGLAKTDRCEIKTLYFKLNTDDNVFGKITRDDDSISTTKNYHQNKKYRL